MPIFILFASAGDENKNSAKSMKTKIYTLNRFVMKATDHMLFLNNIPQGKSFKMGGFVDTILME